MILNNDLEYFFHVPFPILRATTKQMPVPVHEECPHCGDRFTAEDCGLTMPRARAVSLPMHLVCYIRIVAGGANQQRRLCYRPGMTPDPPGLTRREAAELAFKVWVEINNPLVDPA